MLRKIQILLLVIVIFCQYLNLFNIKDIIIFNSENLTTYYTFISGFILTAFISIANNKYFTLIKTNDYRAFKKIINSFKYNLLINFVGLFFCIFSVSIFGYSSNSLIPYISIISLSFLFLFILDLINFMDFSS